MGCPGWFRGCEVHTEEIKGGILAPSLGTHSETDPKSGGGESRDRRAVTALHP